MVDVLADVPPVLVALSLVSAVLFGVALAIRPTPPPRAQPLAATIESVAAAEYPSVETREVTAAAVRISSHAIAVRGPGGTAHATFSYGPVVPVRHATTLWRVLHGVPPDEVFNTPLSFKNALAEARSRSPEWRPNVVRLIVRRVSWGGVDVTLVGA